MTAHTKYPDLTMRDFDAAFTKARAMRLDFFVWQGKTYHTQRADGEPLPRTGLCDPMQDVRVKALVEAVKGMPQDWYDDNCDCESCDTLRAALRDMGAE